ncbi:MAG: hypothetical protein MJ001_09460, partial [Paludibacteraceae bacterium]|nr:hypothetical protein [Paludibacteraceae bacterium]
MRKFLLLFVALALSIGLWAATQTVSYRYPVYKTAGDPASGIASWATASANATVVENTTTTLTSGWYVVTGTNVQTGTLTCNGAVNLILADGAKLTATSGTDGNAGITVSGNVNSLTIYAQSIDPAQMGTLFATGGKSGAGIGGGYYGSGSDITINGGSVTANAGVGAAGIGGGQNGNGSDITINGGSVTANAGAGAAGIGGGQNGSGSDITINGGSVTANAAPGAAGIGGGLNCTGLDITINGGTVTANGGEFGVGIGGGMGGTGLDITVATTLTVKADGNNPPTTVITNTGSDLATALSGKRYVTVEPAPAPAPFSYLAPVYNTEGNPASGILRWDTLSCTDYSLVTNTTT